jgi:multiple sugar transport system ATP-binding protein
VTGIQLNGVTKRYGETEVISGLDLNIHEGEFLVFLGPSGCGKSTLLRMIAGLEVVTEGQISIGGREVTHLPPARRDVAMVFQHYALYPHMTVYDNMAFGLRNSGVVADEIERRITEAARMLELDALLKRRPAQLSGGQRQRVAIGRAVVKEPEAFLFDEPLSNLDASLRTLTRVELARIHRRLNSTMVFVTHDQIEAMTLADKIVLLHAGADTARFGSIAQVGAPLDLYHRPKNRFVAGFIGSPRMNFLPARVVSNGVESVLVALDGTNEQLQVLVNGESLEANQPVTLGIRPEHLEPASSAGTSQHITRTVSLVEQLGEHSYLHLDQPGGSVLVAKAPGDRTPENGAQVLFNVPPASCHLFTEDGLAVAPAAISHLA